MLDAAAYVPTNRLDLSRWQPDFVALSFYKMFGWPTGVGARSPSTSSTPTDESSMNATSTGSPAGTTSRCAPAASATPARGRSPSLSRADTLVGGEFGEGMTLDDYLRVLGPPPAAPSAPRSGVVSNAADLDRFNSFANEFIDLAVVPDDLPSRTGC